MAGKLYNYVMAQRQARLAEEQARKRKEKDEEKKKGNFLSRGLATLGDVAGNVFTGVSKGVEGIVDFGAGVVGAVGGLFDEGFKDDVQDFIEYDATNEWFGKQIDDWTEDSFLNDNELGQMVEGVASGVGQMLPAVAVTLITGGAGAQAGLATLGISAAGSGTEEAYKDGAGFYEGLGYGAASGAVEVATEKLFGGLTGNITGKGVLDFGGEVAEQGAKRIIKGAVEEGAEEVISHYANPLVKTIYKGKDAVKEYTNPEFHKEGGKAFLTGAGTGMVYGGTVGKAINRAKGVNDDIGAAVEANENIREKLIRAQDSGKLTVDAERDAADAELKNLQSIEKSLKKADEKTRKTYIKNYQLESTFNEDGSIKPEILAQERLKIDGKQTVGDAAESENGTAGQLDRRYYSVDLRGKEQTVRDDLKSMSSEGEVIKPFTGELSENAQKNFTKMKKALTSLNKHRGESVSFVIVEENDKFNGAERRGDTIYIAADTLERDAGTSYLDEASKSGNFAGTMLHEYDHTNEGTREHGELISFLAEDEELYNAAAVRVLDSEYGISRAEFEAIQQKDASGMELTADEKGKMQTFVSELGATMNEYYLGNERVISKLVAENEPLVERVLVKIEQMKKALSGKGDKLSISEKRRIDKALKLYEKAAEAAGKMDLVKRIVALREDEEDNSAENEHLSTLSAKNSQKEPLTNIKQENMHVSEGEVRYSRKIEPNMADAERYEVLKKRSINNIPLVTELSDSVLEKIPEISSWEDINKYIGKDKRSLIQKLTKEFGVFEKEYFNEDIEISFEFSGNNFRESYNKQGHNYIEFAKMFSVFDSIIESAVGVEIHNRPNYKSDPTLDNVFVLMSAYQDGDYVVPVKLEVKQFKDKQNTLYVAISLEKIKMAELNARGDTENGVTQRTRSTIQTEVWKQGNTETGVTQNSRSVNISIAEIFEKINPSDKSFIKYIPDGFLNEAQKEAKRQALDAERKAGETKFSRKSSEKETFPYWERAERESIAEYLLFNAANEDERDIVRTYYEELDYIEEKKREQAKLEKELNGIKGNYGEEFDKRRSELKEKIDNIKADVTRRDAELLKLNAADLFREISERAYREGVEDESMRKVSQGARNKIRASIENSYFFERRAAWEAINKIADKYPIEQQAKKRLAYRFWEGLNGKEGVKEQQDFISKMSSEIYFELVEEDQRSDDFKLCRGLERYTGRVFFTEADKRLLEKHFSYIKDEILDIWEYNPKERSYVDPKTAINYLNRMSPDRKTINASTRLEVIEAFIQMHNVYKEAKATPEFVKGYTYMSQAEVIKLKNEIVDVLLDTFRNSGKKTYKARYEEQETKFKTVGKILAEAEQIRKIKLGAFLKANEFKSDILKGTVEALANIQYRRNFNSSGARDIIKSFGEWYVKENPILKAGQDSSGEAMNFNKYDENIALMIKEISDGKGEFTVEELNKLLTVLTYFKNYIKTFNKVKKNGKFVDAQPLAKKEVERIEARQRIKLPLLDSFFKSKFAQFFLRPQTIVKRMDMHEHGFFTEALEEFRQGLIKADNYEYEMMLEVEKFSKENPKYFEKLAKRHIEYKGRKMPVDVAMSLYMTTKRKQAQKGLALSGFRYEDGQIIDVDAAYEKSEDVNVVAEMEAIRRAIYSQLSDQDKAFMKVVEKIFNSDCKQLKYDTDMEIRFYSNVVEGDYFPIYRAFIAKSVDSDYLDLIHAVENQSFNKETEEHAKSFLAIRPLTQVLSTHVKGVAQYAGLAVSIRNYDILYNIDVESKGNRPVSIASESPKVWKEGNAYFKKLLSDMQGRSERESPFLAGMRGAYATYQLGANPKTWVTQMSSLFAATSEISYASIVRGFGVEKTDIYEYCDLAKLRAANNDAVIAQANTSKPATIAQNKKLKKVSDALMTPIGKVDEFVIKQLYGACQVEVESKGGAKVGTKENKIEAGKLLERVIINTQQNSLATERSAAMRSSNTLAKGFQMFRSDAMNTLGQVIDGLGEEMVLKVKLRVATDPKEKAELLKQLKAAKKKTAKAVGSLAASSVYMVAIAFLFNALYHRIEDEDGDGRTIDDIGTDAITGFIGNMIGGIPIASDAYSFLADGYAVESYLFSMINDLLESVSEVMTFCENACTDSFDGRQAKRAVRKVLYSSGQFLGIPVRNMYNITYSVLGFIPSVKYGIDDMFYEQAYTSDLKKAIEAGDERAIATIAGIMMGERVGDIEEDKVREELNKLTLKGYSVLPRAIADSVTVGEDSVELTGKQKKQFKEIYSIANQSVTELIALKQYENAEEEIKAKAVKLVYDIYYQLALDDVVGGSSSNKNVLFAEAISVEKLAIIIATARSIEADKNKNGISISGSKKKKIEKYIQSLNLTAAQKYMIMGYLGYKNSNGESQVKSYINKLNLSDDEKAALLKHSGYN